MNDHFLPELLRIQYGLLIRRMDRVPAGECSLSYVASTETESVFAKIHTRAPGGGPWDLPPLESRLAAVAALRHLPGVVAPLPNRTGGYVLPTPSGPLAVFPAVFGSWTDPDARDGSDLECAAQVLASIHSWRDGAVNELLQPFGDSLAVPYADALRSLLLSLRSSTPSNEVPPFRRAILGQHDEILAALEGLENLAERIRRREPDLVITHGDPNHANILRTPDGSIHLVDWDDIALGPFERDVVFFSGGRFPSFWRAYRQCRHAEPLDEETVLFFLWFWDLQEISDFGTRLLQGRLSAGEIDRAWQELRQYLPVRTDQMEATAREMIDVSEAAAWG